MEYLEASILVGSVRAVIILVAENNGNTPLQRIVKKHLLYMIVPYPVTGTSRDLFRDLTNHFLSPRKLVQHKALLENSSRNNGDIQDIICGPVKGRNSDRLTRPKRDGLD